jgi:hypothetical protein
MRDYELLFWLAVAAAFWPTLWWMQRRGWIDLSKDRVRRGTGHALMGAQEFIKPSVEYVIQAENTEQAESDDREGDDPKMPLRWKKTPPPVDRESS